jgi:hypothetical protein
MPRCKRGTGTEEGEGKIDTKTARTLLDRAHQCEEPWNNLPGLGAYESRMERTYRLQIRSI